MRFQEHQNTPKIENQRWSYKITANKLLEKLFDAITFHNCFYLSFSVNISEIIVNLKLPEDQGTL